MPGWISEGGDEAPGDVAGHQACPRACVLTCSAMQNLCIPVFRTEHSGATMRGVGGLSQHLCVFVAARRSEAALPLLFGTNIQLCLCLLWARWLRLLSSKSPSRIFRCVWTVTHFLSFRLNAPPQWIRNKRVRMLLKRRLPALI